MSAHKKRWRCTVCGYIHEGDEPSLICPICNVPKDKFELIDTGIAEAEAEADPKRWYCKVCGYIHIGDGPPDLCPVCGVGPDLFDLMADDDDGEEPDDFGKIVIIGGGIAGLSAVEAICRRTARAEVTLISDEDALPYYRLNLTRYLAGEVDEESLTVRDKDWYPDKGIKLIKGVSVNRIDTKGKMLALSDNSMILYDRLVIATGAQPVIPPIPGIELEGVHTLRTLEDGNRILAEAQPGKRAIVIGGGILGLEMAGALNRQQLEVSVLSNGPTLLPRQLTPDSATVMHAEISELGISVLVDASTSQIARNGDTLIVSLADGRSLETDIVLVAVGIRPSLELAEASGLECNHGIIVNDMMRTSDHDIFAAGDVAEQHGVMYGLWQPALLQGAVAGSNASGASETFDGIPPTTVIKVLGIGMFSAGEFNQISDEQVRFYGYAEGTFYDLLFENGRLVGANEVGDVHLSTTLSHLIENHVDMSAHLTSDASLKSILEAVKASS